MKTTIQSLVEPTELDSEKVLLSLLDNMIWPILAITFVAFSIFLPVFYSLGNVRAMLFSAAALSAIVLAESLCLLSGHFDLSVGSIAGFSAIFMGVFLTSWFPNTPGSVAIVLILVVGGVIGLMNGLSIAYIGVNPFLQTLAFLMIFRGGVTWLSTASMTDLPELYLFVGGGNIDRVPVAVILMAAIYVLAGLWLKYSKTGRAVYAVGGNKQAAREAGINTEFVVVLVYVLSGVLSALGGLLFTGFLGAATPTIAEQALFPAFAAAVIGGVSLFGGRGNVAGAAGGVLLLGMIQSGLVLLRVDPTTINMINGIVLLVAVILYTLEERFRTRLLAS